MPNDKQHAREPLPPITTDDAERLIGALDDVSYEAYVLSGTINDLRHSVDLLIQQNDRVILAGQPVIHVKSMSLDPCDPNFKINQITEMGLSDGNQAYASDSQQPNHQPELW